jgi:hypothetical protein
MLRSRARIGREEGKGQNGEESVSFVNAERWLDRRDWGCGLQRQRQQQRGAERKRGVRLGGRGGLPTHRPTLRFGLDSDLACRQERSETLRVSRWGWQAQNTAQMAQ